MRKRAPIVLVIVGLVAAAGFVANGEGDQPVTTLPREGATPSPGVGDWRVGAGSQPRAEAPDGRVGARDSAHRDPFQTGRSWPTGHATASMGFVYLDPDSDIFQAAARKVLAEHDATAVESPLQLISPEPPDPAAAF